MNVPLCNTCACATWDYERYYGSTAKDWFITGCKKGLEDGAEGEECEGYEEYETN